MSTSITKRALEIVEQALDLPADRRIAFVEQTCGDDAELRREVESMLAFDSGVEIEQLDIAEEFDESSIMSNDLERYEILHELGRGGMGTVYRAHDHHLDRDVAIKVLRPGQDIGTALRRFALEARIGARLQHPGIAPVYDLGRLPDGRPFFAMKLVGGDTLGSLLAVRTNPQADRARLLAAFEQLCQTIAYAHAHGIIHRDLKPDNVMLGEFSEVQVMDWGLAKVIADGDAGKGNDAGESDKATEGHSSPVNWSPSASPETQAGIVMGTPAYMPPEQATGQRGKPTDVFSLGAILCEILTLEPPYTAESPADVFRKSAEADLEEANARLKQCSADPELIEIARHCLLPCAEERPQDAGAVAGRVSGYLRAVESRLREAQMATARSEAKAVEESKRRRATMMWMATVLVLVTVILGGWAWIAQRNATRIQDEANRQAEVIQRLAHAQAEAIRLHEIAQNAPLDDLSAWQTARIAINQARTLVEANDVSEELAKNITQLARDFSQQESNRKLLAGIETAREESMQQITVLGEEEPSLREKLRQKLGAVFRTTPLHPTSGRNNRAVEFFNSEDPRIKEALIGAVDEWMVACDSTSDRQWLVEITNMVDTNHWRKGWRKAVVDRDFQALTEILHGDGTLEQSPRSVLNLCSAVEAAVPGSNTKSTLLRLYPAHADDFWLNYALANRFRADGEHDEAFRSYSVCLGMRPLSSLYRWIGNIQTIKAQYDEAIYHLQRAIDLNDQSVMSWESLAGAYLRSGRLKEARSAFERARALCGDNLEQVNQYSNLLYRSGEVEQAIEFARARQLESGRTAILRRIWFIYLLSQEERYLEAAQAFERPFEMRADYDFRAHIVAAVAAVRAADGQGKDAADLSVEQRRELRRNALRWMREALETWLARRPESAPVLKDIVNARDSGKLNSVYQPEALSRLSAAEQAAWHRFWFNVIEAERQLTYVDPALSDLSKWAAIDPVSVSSEAGASFERLSDGSFLVSGPHEEGDVYAIRADLDARWITAIRLDLLADDRLPGKGPGRHEIGNFHLAEFSVELPDETSDSGARLIPIQQAWATYSWPGRPVANAIDSNPDSVWHIFSRQGEPHAAIFFLRDPITPADAGPLTIRLIHGGDGATAAIGRFRLSIQRDGPLDDGESVSDKAVE